MYATPELLATAPNQAWSWDITTLKGPTTWSWSHLYVILDVYSCYVVGWMLAPRESAVLADTFIVTCCTRGGIVRDQLTLHPDRGSSMTSQPVALLLADLGVTTSPSRPHVSDDNPDLEAQCKTLTYRPDSPARFGSLKDARAHGVDFFRWHPTAHHHSRLGLQTPAAVHHGLPAARNTARAPDRGVCHTSRTVCPPTAHAPPAPDRRVNKSLLAAGRRGRRSLNFD